MPRVILIAMQAQPGGGASVAGTALLVVAALVLLTAIDMLRHALSPLREVLRALAAAGAMTALVLLAFAMIVAALIIR